MAKKKRKGVYARDIDRLNRWFAVVAIITLASVMWMIWDDYAAPWKSYQRQFRVIQNEVTEQQLLDEEAGIDQEKLAELATQRDAAEQTLSEQADTIAALEATLAPLRTKLDLADQNLRFSRSEYDSVRWRFEEARKHAGDEGATSEREAMELAAADIATYAAEVEELTLAITAADEELAALNADRDTAAGEIATMNREIERLRGRLDALRFDWAYYLRNAPFMDGLNPSLRINQVVLDDIRFDLNFTDAPQVDRCESCHLGVRSAEYETYEQPFASHPRLDLFVADTSIHPAGEFGCTACHGGKGHATSFTSAVHTPDNEIEAERWHEELGWEHVELWEWPMRSGDEIEAGCVKCHVDDTWLPDAPKVEYGLELIEKLGCYGCHQIDRWDEARKRGPDLSHLSVKTDAEWAYNWLMDPKSFRPETPMPRFFNLANTSDEYWTERNKVEAEAIVSYLFDSATPIELDKAPASDATTGEALFNSVGCLGCHQVGDFDNAEDLAPEDARFAGLRHHGPNLSGMGSKVNADWLFTWVTNPNHYWAETVMPQLRLSDSEAADITAYLMGLDKPGWDEATIPSTDAALRDEVALEYLVQQLPSAAAQARLDGLDDNAKRIYLGERLINRYGCAGCHTIPGFDSVGRIGTSLSDWGSKAVAQLDFGLQDLEHGRRAFLEEKLRQPRIFDEGRVRGNQELLRMPNFDLTEREIDAIATAIVGFTDQQMRPEAKPERTPRHQAIAAGRKVVDEFNCRGCHIIEDRGGALRGVIADNMVESGEVNNRAAGLSFGPPNLRSQGARTQPDWLYRFFKTPTTVRPWLRARMPTFPFTDQQLNDLTAYFAALDEVPYPFEAVFTGNHEFPVHLVSEGGTLAAALQCEACHFFAGKEPRADPKNWAPDLALARDRLRPDWINGWIKDPQSLQPGTNMPQFYSDLSPGRGFWTPLGNDPQVEIDALVAYIMSIGK